MTRAVLATAGALLLSCGVAHADDNQYVADLAAAGVPMLLGPNAAIANGYTMCAQLRNGASPEVVAGSFGLMSAFGGPAVAAAQHDLCPDTLHGNA